MNKTKKTVLKIVLIVAAIGIAYYIFGSVTGLWIPCMTHMLTGAWCPGCGTTRALLALMRLDVAEAFHDNAALMILAPLWIIYGILCAVSAKFRSNTLLKIMFWVSVALEVIFTVLRNIPYFSFLAPI